MLRVVKGDISKSKESYIVHQGNCQGRWGSGVAKALKEQFPRAHEDYVNKIKNGAKLGDVLYCSDIQVNGSIPNEVTIVTILGQDSYGYDGARYTNYIALVGGIANVLSVVKGDVAIPVRIGCARGGADWNFIESVISKLAEDFDYDVVLYDYDGKDSFMEGK